MINVTKTFFPPLAEYNQFLQRIWKNEWLTNRGELVLELEEKLKNYLSVQSLTLMTNGTIPIQIALKLLGKGGEIITTPFSYVATTSSIVWEGCTPVFVDIDPNYLTIDEKQIEAAITDKTTAILATHVFGNPCAVDKIEEIAKKHNLSVIYDAAHCFGVKYKGKSLFDYGDISTCSFHATKVFHTGEGGAIFCNDAELNHKCFYSHNFGHNGPTDFTGVGINGKMSELQAAMGLAVLPHYPNILKHRKEITDFYNNHLELNLIDRIELREYTEWNHSYYPVIFSNQTQLINCIKKMQSEGINPRRYFYPSLNTINYVKEVSMPISESIASRILCLPISSELSLEDAKRVSSIVNSSIRTTSSI